MSAHEHLERQLRDSVKARAPQPAPARRPRRRGPRRLGLLAAGLIVLGGGVAVAGQIIDHRSTSHRVNDLVAQALSDTAHLQACMPTGARPARLSNATPSVRVTDALPSLATFPSQAPSAQAFAVARPVGGHALLRRTVRILQFDNGLRAVLYVAQGAGPGGPTDPAGCLRARLAKAAALHPAADSVHTRALATIRGRRDTRPGAETLGMSVAHSPNGPWIGTVLPVPPNGLKPGDLITRAPAHNNQIFYGAVASPNAVRATAQSARGQPVTATITDGILGLTAPPDARKFHIEQHSADGQPVGYTHLTVP